MNQDLKDEEMIDIIMRQTNYTYEESERKLKLHEKNIMNVIRENINIGKNKVESEKKEKSLQQAIYSEIRTFMDDVYKNKKQKSELNN
jgi:hypothetical protein